MNKDLRLNKNLIIFLLAIFIFNFSLLSQNDLIDKFYLKDSIFIKYSHNYPNEVVGTGQNITIIDIKPIDNGFLLRYKTNFETNVDYIDIDLLSFYFAEKKSGIYNLIGINPPVIKDDFLEIFISKDVRFFFLQNSYFLRYDFQEILKEFNSKNVQYFPRKSIEKIRKKIDAKNHMNNCINIKNIKKFQNKISDEDVIYYLNNGSLFIKSIVLEDYFKIKREYNREVFLAVKKFKNEIVFLCKGSGYSYFLNFLLFRLEQNKNNNIELYNVLIENGAIPPDEREE